MATPIADRSNGNAQQPALVPTGRPLGSPQGGAWSGRLWQLAWASVPVWSLALLAFVPFLRLALVRRRARDWGVFAG